MILLNPFNSQILFRCIPSSLEKYFKSCSSLEWVCRLELVVSMREKEKDKEEDGDREKEKEKYREKDGDRKIERKRKRRGNKNGDILFLGNIFRYPGDR